MSSGLKKSFEVRKTKKSITSKVDSGVPKRPSTITFTKTNRPQSSTGSSSISNRSSILSIAPQPSTIANKLHKPGQLPVYLRRNRPATAASRLQLKTTISELNQGASGTKNDEGVNAKNLLNLEDYSFRKAQHDVREKYESYVKSKAALDGKDPAESPHLSNLEDAVSRFCVDSDQVDSGAQVKCPPSEGGSDIAAQETILEIKRKELAEMASKLKELMEKYDRQTLDLGLEREKVGMLEIELEAKRVVIAVHSEQTSKLRDVEEKAARYERQLEKSDALVAQLSLRVETLKQQMTTLEEEIKAKETDEFEITAKLVAANVTVEQVQSENRSLMERVNRLDSELQNHRKQIAAMNRELAEKDSMVTKLRAALGCAEVQQTNVICEQIQQLRSENRMLMDAKKNDDIWSAIDSSLEAMAGSYGKVMSSMPDGSTKLSSEEQDRSVIRLRAVISKFSVALEELEADNREMQCITKRILNRQPDGDHLLGESEEKITGRIIYNNL